MSAIAIVVAITGTVMTGVTHAGGTTIAAVTTESAALAAIIGTAVAGVIAVGGIIIKVAIAHRRRATMARHTMTEVTIVDAAMAVIMGMAIMAVAEGMVIIAIDSIHGR